MINTVSGIWRRDTRYSKRFDENLALWMQTFPPFLLLKLPKNELIDYLADAIPPFGVYGIFKENHVKGKTLLEELYSNGEELPVVMFERHRFEPRIHYRIYTIAVSNKKYITFMEVFDGSSAKYEYEFCGSRKKCKQIMEMREAGNKKLY